MNVVSTLVALIGVDRVGRRFLFISSGIVMVACEIIVGVTLGHYFSVNQGSLPDNVSNGVLAVICFYVANFAWSWGKTASRFELCYPFLLTRSNRLTRGGNIFYIALEETIAIISSRHIHHERS